MPDSQDISIHSEACSRATEYAHRRNLTITDQLGYGFDGVVLSTSSATQPTRKTAVKSLRFADLYIKERNVYLRLQERNVGKVGIFSVPRLIAAHDELWVIEMEIVTPPFIVDFAGAYLDQTPPYIRDRKIMSRWHREKASQFGTNWSTVKTALAIFRSHGIHLADVKPGNVAF